MVTQTEKTNATFIHLSAFASYIIPLGSIIMPIILWQTLKKDSDYTDYHGKEAVNFNLSFLLYNLATILLFFTTVIITLLVGVAESEYVGSYEDLPFILFGMGGVLGALLIIISLNVIKLILIIIASVRANRGELYKYPISIRFIK